MAVFIPYVERCGKPRMLGHWDFVAAFQADVGETVTVSTGYTSSKSITDATEWRREMSVSVSAGFEAFGASTSVTVGSSWSRGASHSVVTAAEHKLTKTISFTPQVSGTVWQWKFHASDGCNNADLATGSKAITPFRDAPPCCPPGLFADPDVAHGPCRESSLYMC